MAKHRIESDTIFNHAYRICCFSHERRMKILRKKKNIVRCFDRNCFLRRQGIPPPGFGFESSLAIPLSLPAPPFPAPLFNATGSVSFSQPDAAEPAESHLTTSARPSSQVNGFERRASIVLLLLPSPFFISTRISKPVNFTTIDTIQI